MKEDCTVLLGQSVADDRDSLPLVMVIGDADNIIRRLIELRV